MATFWARLKCRSTIRFCNVIGINCTYPGLGIVFNSISSPKSHSASISADLTSEMGAFVLSRRDLIAAIWEDATARPLWCTSTPSMNTFCNCALLSSPRVRRYMTDTEITFFQMSGLHQRCGSQMMGFPDATSEAELSKPWNTAVDGSGATSIESHSQ